MNYDDIVYVSLLLFSILFGKFYRSIQNLHVRKIVGTLVGLLIVYVVSGFHIIHALFTFLVNAIIIRNINPKICHKVSFVFSFLYLFFFRTTSYFGIPYPPAHTNLVQMILTLKIVGLAFEVNRSYVNSKDHGENKDVEEKDYNKINPGYVDIFHYCFNYMGVLTGPYYRYTTFRDSFNTPFASFVNSWSFTLQKLKFVPVFIGLFLWSSTTWPLSYAVTDEFYNDRSWLYRYWYIWPNFFTFRMRIYIGLVLSECVCTMGGLGVYPVSCKPKPGQGPSENFTSITKISENEKYLSQEKFNYDAIKNINPYGADFCVTYREGMKHWNICVQYWLAVNIYKNCPLRQFRTHITLFVSAIWHGVYTGYYVCIGSVPFVLILEDLWVKLLLKSEHEKRSEMELKIYKFAIWFSKMHFFSYQAIAFHLLEVRKVFDYYNSIYHVGLVLGIALYLAGLILNKRSSSVKHEENIKPKEQNFTNMTKPHSN
ncbi:hypothetical protein WA026_010685 [Henosepilachna vigintioctopunctata]|uniref:Lysophospholipid acyltransferase 7 n=1 Tax=Henosepilachna vigintioctopunctata TaxID=420089 RepID=A0AAW1UNK1_9CUCU